MLNYQVWVVIKKEIVYHANYYLGKTSSDYRSQIILTLISPGCFCNLSSQGSCNTHRFSIINREGPMMLYLVPMYRSWFPLCISTKISTNNFHVTSLWRHILENDKNRKKMQNSFFNIKSCGSVAKFSKNEQVNIRKINLGSTEKLYFSKKHSVGCVPI